jgi:hypothetical protein
VTISKDLQRFNSPDFGLKGPKVSPFKKGMPTNTTPGIANNVDIFSGVTEMMEDYYSPERADDGISGTRLAKVLYYEVLDTDKIPDPIMPTLLASAQGDLSRSVLCVYAAVSGGSCSMLPLPRTQLPMDQADLTRIYRFPRFYALTDSDESSSWINQTCLVEYVDDTLNSYGLFHGMTNTGTPMPSGNPDQNSTSDKFNNANTPKINVPRTPHSRIPPNEDPRKNDRVIDRFEARNPGATGKFKGIKFEVVQGVIGGYEVQLQPATYQAYKKLVDMWDYKKDGILRPTSHFRPQNKNKGSQHGWARALDIAIPGRFPEDDVNFMHSKQKQREHWEWKMRLVRAAYKLGFTSFGFGKNIVHIDTRGRGADVGQTNSKGSFWGYDSKGFIGYSALAQLKGAARQNKLKEMERYVPPGFFARMKQLRLRIDTDEVRKQVGLIS